MARAFVRLIMMARPNLLSTYSAPSQHLPQDPRRRGMCLLVYRLPTYHGLCMMGKVGELEGERNLPASPACITEPDEP